MHDIENAVAHDDFALARTLTDEVGNLLGRLDLVLVVLTE
jgi:hypothetical protein